ncbi:MAG: metallophosphoesterase [Pseudomonadota bacterium]
MRLFAISDLHLDSPSNFEAFAALPAFPEDWIIVAGDLASRFDRLEAGFAHLSDRFAQVIWVPGNHDLWTSPARKETEPGGVARYERVINLARQYGVLTPEDPYRVWPHPAPDGRTILLAPLFLLYDYSFRPDHIALDDVVDWAREFRNVCADETYLQPDPFKSRVDWCHDRLRQTEARLSPLVGEDVATILINHWPLRADLVRIPRIPRFTPWCGTVLTHDWHSRFKATCVVTGHLHTRRTDRIGGTRFEEVSLGYPIQWKSERGIADYFRRIL